ncbi:MAG: hypothetical protein JHC85_03965 [Chthoniobacterales bacterium]|nr:hypothetical protein [Chthoniobacterales bacterium]
MKSIPSLRIGLGVLAALTLPISGNLYGQVIYEDDFSANPGALNGRTTATGFGNWTTTDSAFQVGGGQITINTNNPVDYHAATFALPTLTDSDILSLTITLRPSGPIFTGFGFTPGSAQYVQNTGYNWIYFASGNPTIQVLTGPSATGLIYSAELTNPALNFDPSLPTTFQYTYSASAKTLTITATNGTNSSLLLNNFDASATPLSGFSNFALQFQGQTLGTDPNPAYVDYLKVEVIPVITITSTSYSANAFSLTWSGTGSLPVTIQRREALTSGQWTAIGQQVTTGQFTDANTPPGQAFYRVVYP